MLAFSFARARAAIPYEVVCSFPDGNFSKAIANGILTTSMYGTGAEISVLELARMIWLLCDRNEPFEIRNKPGYSDDVEKRVPDVSKIRRLGWSPKTDLNVGLSITVPWLSSKLASQSASIRT